MVRRLGHAPRVDPLPIRPGDLDVGDFGPLPGRLGAPPVLGQDLTGLHRGVEQVQAVLQGRGRWVVAAGLGEVRDRLGDPLGGVGDDELEAVEPAQMPLPGRGLAVGGGLAEDGGQARRLDTDQGRSPPKKISSTASVWTRGTQAASRASRTCLALPASSATHRPMVE
jgi:hypothetical protein